MVQAKTKSGYRVLALFPTAEACLMQVKRQQEENREFFGNTYHDTHDYVFTHDDGTPYRPDYLTSKFAATVMNVYAQYVRFKSNVAESDLTAKTESVADLFQ